MRGARMRIGGELLKTLVLWSYFVALAQEVPECIRIAESDAQQQCHHGRWTLKQQDLGCAGGIVCKCAGQDWGGPACDKAQWHGPPPNVVIVMADDLGYGDVGYTGGVARTPNIDAMSRSDNAIVFTNFHSGAPVCSPTRASIVTGRTPTRDCVDKAQGCYDDADCSMRYPLSVNTFSIADLVHKYETTVPHSGEATTYAAGVWGKWHLGNVRPKPRATNGRSQLTKFPEYVAHPGMFGFDVFSVSEDEVPAVQPNCGCFKGKHGAAIGTGKKFLNRKRPTWDDYSRAVYRIPKSWRQAVPISADHLPVSAHSLDMEDVHYRNTDGVCYYGHYKVDDADFQCTNYFSFENQHEAADEQCDFGGADGAYLNAGNGKIVTDDSTYLVDQFEAFVKSNAGKRPFLGLLWLHTVHHPFIASPVWQQLCLLGKACDLEKAAVNAAHMGRMPPNSAAHPVFSSQVLTSSSATNASSTGQDIMTGSALDYHASIAQVDDQFGRIQDILRDNGVHNNTILIFTSDNGPEGKDLLKVGGVGNHENPGSTGGFKGRKRDVWEGGHRVPFVLQWPARISTNVATNFPAVTTDYFATLQDILQVSLSSASNSTNPRTDSENHPPSQRTPEIFPRDGVSLLPTITALALRTKQLQQYLSHSIISVPVNSTATNPEPWVKSKLSTNVQDQVGQALLEDRVRQQFLQQLREPAQAKTNVRGASRVLKSCDSPS